ncbi:hypothetical protein BN891_34680 [Bacteroides xylanisolvens SD CC 2a]|nr:hypothetical protein BN891_34680 [Bacteroides xylanisolvens SD CC 2a]
MLLLNSFIIFVRVGLLAAIIGDTFTAAPTWVSTRYNDEITALTLQM